MWSWKRQAQRIACLSVMPRSRVTWQNEPGLSLDRRQLLTSVAVITTAGFAPIAESAGPAYPAEAATEATLPASDVPAWNVCSSTARKMRKLLREI
jgi:hypothetical protein